MSKHPVKLSLDSRVAELEAAVHTLLSRVQHLEQCKQAFEESPEFQEVLQRRQQSQPTSMYVNVIGLNCNAEITSAFFEYLTNNIAADKFRLVTTDPIPPAPVTLYLIHAISQKLDDMFDRTILERNSGPGTKLVAIYT
eukprot:Phypoly_transcript_21319.p1 GENE.Phypoly_transcript_21319~~Phypoly_transcript_21319.p1  ORF type:complete len:139 (+),score=18.13 Phypoly_transcript_21319:54-470(+)